MKIISPIQQRPVAWKNGNGITREIAQFPASQPYNWRLSIAEMDGHAEFSTFPGLRRVLTVIAGQGMVFATPTGQIEVNPYEPVVFDGNLKVEATLNDGPVQNFNLIYNPERLRTDFQVLTGRHSLQLPNCPGRTVAFYVIQGNATFDGSSLREGETAISVETAETTCTLEAGIGVLFTLDKI